MSTQARRRYSEVFKREAVRLVTEGGHPPEVGAAVQYGAWLLELHAQPQPQVSA